MPIDRYHRQTLLPQLGDAGQRRLRAAHVLVLGVGALGATVADQLVRAGVGTMTLVDRDVVERTNLQRQTLYDEADAQQGVPKVEAAARRLHAINGDVTLRPRALDVDAGNILSLVGDANLIVDGSDNAELRYLVNDVSVKRGVPWVMGGVLGVEGRICAFDPRPLDDGSRGPCLCCLFPIPPAPGELATCDTAGVLGSAVGVVASLQAASAIRLLVGDRAASATLTSVDVWANRFHSIDVRAARREDCPCCASRTFEFLDRPNAGSAKLCGRNAIQVRPPAGAPRVNLAELGKRLSPIATIAATELMLKVILNERPELSMNLFGDGRMIVFGTSDAAVARSIYARLIGI